MSDLTPEQKLVQLEWLKEQGADLRARTQAEYFYTAAALALYGGVCWGVAALRKSGPSVAIGVAIVAVLIGLKIYADHRTYSKIWKVRERNIDRLQVLGPPPKKAGWGYLISIVIVLMAGFSAAGFCLLFAGSSCA